MRRGRMTEAEFGQTELDIVMERIDHGRDTLPPWFERLSQEEQADLVLYLSWLERVRMG